MAALTDLAPEDPAAERHQKLLSLKRLELTSESLQQTRDHCVEAHTALMLAEAAQAMARVQLGKAQPADGGALSPTATAEISKAIRRSSTQLEVAKGAFAACDEAARRLATKYR